HRAAVGRRSVEASVGGEVDDHVDPGEAAAQDWVTHVGTAPGDAGHVAACRVDADDLLEALVRGQPSDDAFAERAGGPGHGDGRRAALCANACSAGGHGSHLDGYRGLMSDLPFGFTGGAGPEGADLGAMLRQLGDLMSGQSGPVNWNLARQAAMQAIGADAGTTTADTEQIDAAVRLADVWLDQQTALPSGVTATEAWSRRRWLEATQPAWSELVEPVAARVASSFGDVMPE